MKQHIALGVFALAGCSNGFDVTASTDAQAIVNGAPTTIGEHPWQLSLQSGGFEFCGASLIAPDWVLTAQHCVEGVSANQLDAVGGMTRLSEGGTARGVAAIIRNPGFSSPENGHDAALLHLSQPFTLGGVIQAIEIVTPSDFESGVTDPGVIANVSGWGALSSQGQETPDQLQDVDVVIKSMAVAEQSYGPLSDDQLAAGGDSGDSCQGDSGGPLTVESARGTLLAGVVSWGNGCADGFPGMYARVSAMNDWITSTMNGTAPVDPDAEGWMCNPSYLGDGECDCGCGAFDDDCPSNSVGACQFNNCDEWQPTPGLELNSADPTQCAGGIPPDGGEECPPNASITPDGSACACNEGFVPNASLTECVADEEPVTCPANTTQAADGSCACNDGFEPNDSGCIEIDDGANAQSDRDDDDDEEEDPPGCAGTAGATPLAGLALLALVRRRRR